jgi:hypothetical protein
MYTAIRQLEFDPIKSVGEILDEVSETIEGQAYNVKDILVKFTQGTLPNIGLPVHWDGDPDFDSIDPTLSPEFDLSDTDNIQERIDLLNREILSQESPTPEDSGSYPETDSPQVGV